MVCHAGWPFDFIMGGLRLHCKQRYIINNMLHIKRNVIWIKPILCQLEQIGRKRRRGMGCSFALQPTVHLLYFMIFLHVSLEAVQTVKSIGQSGGVLDEF